MTTPGPPAKQPANPRTAALPRVRPDRPHPGAPRGDAAAGQAARRHPRRADDRACLAPRRARPASVRSRSRPTPRPSPRRSTRAGGRAVMTRADHASGSDRIFEARRGDRSGRAPRRRGQRAGRPADHRPAGDRGRDHCRSPTRAVDIATLAAAIIPATRSGPTRTWSSSSAARSRRPPARALFHPRHGALRRRPALSPYRPLRLSPRARSRASSALPPSPLERRERLEQLRALEAGMRIDAVVVDDVPLGVDTPARSRAARARSSGRPETAMTHEASSPSRASPAPTRTSPARRRIRTGSRCPARPSRTPSRRSATARPALAMIPIENSIAGRVADIHHLLPTSGLHIVGEHFLPIHFQLMATAGADLGTIKTVHSHVHALGQCRKIIRKLGLKAVVAGDTAGSAREIAEAGDPTRASLAPRLAAEIYGLKIARRGRRGRGPQHHPLHHPVERRPTGPRRRTARRSRASSSACATCRRRSTRRSAASRPTAST